MSRPSWIKIITDAILFLVGVGIIMRQAGLPLPLVEPLEGKPDYVLLVIGGLLCNGPVFLAAISARFGTGGPSPSQAPGPADTPSESSSAP